MSENVVQLANPVDESVPEQDGTEFVSVFNPESFFFQTPALEKLNEALVRSVNDKGFLTVIKGEEGSGKTALLRQFLRQIQPEWALCLIQVNHVIGEKHILEQLNNHFFPYNHYDVDTLAERLLASEDACWPVILVDDADKLSSFALNVLLSLKFSIEEQGGRLGLILLASPAIQALLSSPSLLRHDEIVRVIDMPTLREQEAMAYIDQCLLARVAPSAVQSSSEVSASVETGLALGKKQAIVRRSGGHPGKLNALLADAIKRQGREPSPLWVWLRQTLRQPRLWSVAAGLLLLTYAVSSWMSAPPREDNIVAANSTLNSQELLPSAGQEKEKKATPARVVVAKPAIMAEKITRKPRISVSKPPVSTPVKAKMAATVAPSVSEPSHAAPVSQSATIVAETSVVNVPVDGQNWLLAQNSGDYTIQLAASAYADAIERFIRNQPVIDGMRYVHIVRRDKDWYVTLYGAYPTFSKAKQAITDLPASMVKKSPWIRRISALQAMLPVPMTVTDKEVVTPLVLETEAPQAVPEVSTKVVDVDVEPAVLSSGSAATAVVIPTQPE